MAEILKNGATVFRLAWRYYWIKKDHLQKAVDKVNMFVNTENSLRLFLLIFLP